MAQYKVGKNIIWEDTGRMNVYNYPPTKNTFSYVKKIYREFNTEQLGSRIVEGELVYFHEMTPEQRALAIVFGNANNALYDSLPNQKSLKPLKNPFK